MDFGQLSPQKKFDPSRAPLHFVARGNPETPFILHLGAPQWSIPEWVGKIYPKGAKPADYLAHYANQWNSIELNTSFYKIPSIEQVEAWGARTPADFRFFVKVYQGISHEADAWADFRIFQKRAHDFVQAWSALGPRLGGFFLQLPPEFGPQRLGHLAQALSVFPKDIPLDVEFRHPDWFKDRQLIAPARELLITGGYGTVITDTPGRRDASHGTLTTERLFVRFLAQSTVEHPNPLPIDIERITAWADAIVRSRAAGLKSYSFFVHTPDQFWVPELAEIFVARLRERGISRAPEAPKRVQEPQLGLF